MSEMDEMGEMEERLRRAVEARMGAVDPQSDLADVERRVGSARSSRRRGLALLGAAASVVVVAGALAIASRGGDSERVEIPPVATDPEVTTTTAPAPTTVPVAPEQPAVWPFESMSVTYATPEEAALSFAQAYLGMPDAQVTGETVDNEGVSVVSIRPFATGGPVTEIELMDRGVRGWVVVGAQSSDISVASPVAWDALSDPLAVRGQSTAFEATINLEIRRYGSLERVGERGFTMGGSNGEMGPFATSFDVPDGVTEGVLVIGAPDMSARGDLIAAAVVPLVAAPASPSHTIVAWRGPELVVGATVIGGSAAGILHALSFGGGLIATDDRDYTAEGQVACSRLITVQDLDGSVVREVAGDRPALSPDGRLAYVDCDNRIVGEGFGSVDIPPETGVTSLAWFGDGQILASLDGEGGPYLNLFPAPAGTERIPLVPGSLGTPRGRFGTIAFVDDGPSSDTIASVDTQGNVTPLVAAPARVVSLDADESGRDLLWVDENHDLWSWSGGEPVLLGTGYTAAAW